MKYALIGYGRMGRAIDEQASARGHHRVAVVDSAGEAGSLSRERLEGAEMAFEFTVGEAAEDNVASLIRSGIPVVCGTTGWQPGAALTRELGSSTVGVVLAPNFSVGVNLFFRVVDLAGRLYGTLGLHEPFVHEAHHRAKRDVPSGTARRIASILLDADPHLHSIQEGNVEGPTEPGVLQVASTRAGAEPGMHFVGFDGEHDSISLCHRARGREGFAAGAVLAAEWLLGRSGLHSFEDALDDILKRGGPRQGGIK